MPGSGRLSILIQSEGNLRISEQRLTEDKGTTIRSILLRLKEEGDQ